MCFVNEEIRRVLARYVVVWCGALEEGVLPFSSPTHSCGTWDVTWGGGSGSMWLGGYVMWTMGNCTRGYHTIDHRRGEYTMHMQMSTGFRQE